MRAVSYKFFLGHSTAGDIGNKISQWADAKSNLENVRKTFIEKEHSIKLEQMRERHEEEMRILKRAAQTDEDMKKEQHTLRLQLMKEEHKIKMQNLIKQ